jgi:hypothetical protein
MKMEYLYRFSDDYTSNGFKRLMKDGYTFIICITTYANHTAPDTQSIYRCNAFSAHYGIAGNEWFNKATGKDSLQYDADVKILR